MLTRCPTCQTTFRVTAEQLRHRQGRVRCGHCHSVFDGLQCLLDESSAVPTQTPAVVAPAIHSPPPIPETTAPGVTITSPKPVVASPKPDFTDTSPIADVAPAAVMDEEAVAEPEIEYVELDEPDFDDDFDLEPSGDHDEAEEPVEPVEDVNPFTKTVVGFGRYFADSLTPPGIDMPDIFIDIDMPLPVDVDADVDADASSAAGSRPAAALPTATETDDDFASTIVMGMRRKEASAFGPVEFPDVRIDIDAAHQGTTLPAPAAMADIVVPDESASSEPVPSEPPPSEPVAVDIEPAKAAEPSRPVEPRAPPAPARQEDDDFTKTVVISMRPQEGADFGGIVFPGVSRFASPDARGSQPAQTAGDSGLLPEGLDETTTIPYTPAPSPANPGIPATAARDVAMDVGIGSAVDVDTVVLPRHSVTPQESATTGLDIDLGSFDEFVVDEEEEEITSVTDIQAPSIDFPTIDSHDTDSDLPSHERANALLRELVPSAVPLIKTVQMPADAPATLPLDDEPATGTDLPLAGAITEPPATDEAHAPTVPPVDEASAPEAFAIEAEAEPVPELQDIPTPRRWPWIAGSVAALCLLAIQMIVHFRTELSVTIPGAKPALVAMCEVLDCKVPLPSQIEMIGIDSSDLSPSADTPGNLQLNASLRNRASFNQTWPHLELTLTDATDKPLVRRALAPSDYLPSIRKIEEGFPARTEQPVYLSLKAPGVPAAGYRLYVFYP